MSYRSLIAAALAVAAAATAVAGVGSPPRVPIVQPKPAVVSVPRTELGCPEVPGRADTTVLAAAPGPTQPSAVVAGTVQMLSIPTRAGEPVLAESTHRGLLRHPVPAADGTGIVISASGALAPGAAADLVATARGRKAAGISTGHCSPAAGSWWFTGVDTSVGRTSRLTLTNTSAAPAVIDLVFFGPHGVVDASGSRGIAVPARSQRALDLASLAPGVDALTVHVSVQQGTVSAAVHTVARAGLTPVGADWIAPAAPPSTALVVGPAVASTGRQLLVLTNPGSREALGAISIVDATGEFTPTKLASVRIRPGSVAVTDVTSVLDGQPAAVRVAASVALTGAVETIERRPVPDFATVGSTLALTAPATVPLVPATEPDLLLTTADRGGASVRIDDFDRAGNRVRRELVEVTGRTTVAWHPRPHDSGAYLVVAAVRGDSVHAVAYFRNRYGVAALPVLPAEWSIRLPVVQPAP